MEATEAGAALAERMCIVTREVKDEAELIRFVRSPDGTAVPDLARKLPGRGVWVSLDRDAWPRRSGRRLFSRGFAAETKARRGPADGLSATCCASRRCRYLSLAKKAGEAVTGFMKVEEMLGRGPAQICCSMPPKQQPDGCRKLDRLAGPGRGKDRSVFPRSTNWIWPLAGQMWYMQPWPRAGLPKSSSLACAGSRRLRPFEGLRDLKREYDRQQRQRPQARKSPGWRYADAQKAFDRTEQGEAELWRRPHQDRGCRDQAQALRR